MQQGKTILFNKVTLFFAFLFGALFGFAAIQQYSNISTDNTDMKHVVLLGDSILDNEVYVRDKSGSVISQLKALVEPKGWRATLCAVDGNVISHIHRQLKTVPKDATHLVISIGGNNALGNLGVLSQPVTNVRDGLLKLNEVKLKFQNEYQHMLKTVLQHNLPVTLCTIYNPRFDSKTDQAAASIGLNVLNDVIIAEAAKAGLPIVDLRVIFTEYDDYANSIEPGVKGGAKIVKNINRILDEHDFAAKKSTIYCDV